MLIEWIIKFELREPEPPGSTCNPKSGAFQDKNLLRESPDELLFTRGGVEDTRPEAKAKDTKKNPRPRTALPRTDPLEAKDQGHKRKCSLKTFFSGDLKKKSSKKCLLELELCSKDFYVQAYADDLAVLVTGADMLWIRGMAQKTINIAANWALEQELQLSSKKTEIVLFTHKRNPDLGSLSMNGSKLELSKEARL